MDRMDVGLKEQVSLQRTSAGHRRAHNRPKKRLEGLLRLEEDIQHEWKEFQWSEVEIDWFIDQEEALPVEGEDENRMDLD